MQASDVNELWDTAKQIAAAVGSGVLTILFLRRKKSKDDSEIHKDRAGSSLLDKIAEERDRALEEADRQRRNADAANDKLRTFQEKMSELSERALKSDLRLEGCEREQTRIQSDLLRAEAELTECRKRAFVEVADCQKKIRRLQREIAKVNPNHEDVQGSDFAGLDE